MLYLYYDDKKFNSMPDISQIRLGTMATIYSDLICKEISKNYP